MADIFEEVEDDLKQERALKLWKRFGPYVLALAIAIVAGTAGFVAWRDYDRRQSEAAAGRLLAAAGLAQEGETERAIAAYAGVVREAGSGYATIARLSEAAVKARSGDANGAAAVYAAIAADTSVPQELRDAAALLGAFQAAQDGNFAEAERRAAPFAAAPGPWRTAALEISAIAALNGGDAAKARDLYARIADDASAPPGQRARAAEMLAAIGG